jgi:hypothetical protein
VGFYSLNLDTMFQHFPYCFGISYQENKTLVKDDANNPVDKIINSQIDEYHDNAKFNPKESLKKLKKIEQVHSIYCLLLLDWLLLPKLPILKLFCLLVFLQVRNPKISPIIKLIILAQLPKSDKSIISSNYIILLNFLMMRLKFLLKPINFA